MKPIEAYRKYGSIDKAWKLSNVEMSRQEFRESLGVPEFRTKVKVGPEPIMPSAGSTKDGRYRVCHFTDLHSGSEHFHQKGLERFFEQAWDEGCRVACNSGDNLDGNRPVLLYDQVTNRWDKQVEILRKVKKPPFEAVLFLDGNHDGYHSESAGFVSGKLLAKELGWTYLGACKGHAKIHGATWEFWHPMGGGGSKNTIRTMIHDRLEHSDYNIVSLGHYHRFTTVLDCINNRFGFSGGTFQLKRSEFANRIAKPWDIGGTIVSYTLENGIPSEYSAKFISVE